MGRSEKFWDRSAEKYAASPIKDDASYQKKLEITRRYLQPDMQVLEFGCGTGSTALLHASYVSHILAIDFSSEMIRIAQEKAAAQGTSHVTFQKAVLEDMAGETFDAVLGLNILHLLPDLDRALRHVYELLPPGGVFVSSTALLSGRWRLLMPVLVIGRWLGRVPLVRFLSERRLLKSIAAAGFTIEEHWRPEKSIGVFIVARKGPTE